MVACVLVRVCDMDDREVGWLIRLLSTESCVWCVVLRVANTEALVLDNFFFPSLMQSSLTLVCLGVSNDVYDGKVEY